MLKHRASSPPVFAWLLLAMNKEIETYWAQPNFQSAGQQRNNLVEVGMGARGARRRRQGDKVDERMVVEEKEASRQEGCVDTGV